MTAVTTIKPHLKSIECPSEIRTLRAWVMWRLEYHEGEDKPRKVPYYASGARRFHKQGSADDRQQLVTFDAARTAAAKRGMDGVGLALLPEWGITALDFDHCVLPSGELHPDVAEIACQSYAEWSPSGQGVRVLFKGNLLNRKSFDGDYGFETFSTKGFVTFTGNTLDITELMGNEGTVADVTEEVMALFSRRFGQRADREAVSHDDQVLGLTPAEIERALEAMDPSMGHDDWLHAGMALHHETRGEGFELWNDWSERSDKYPGRDVLRHRWDSFGRYDGPSVTGKTLVRLAGGAGVFIGPAAPASPDEFEVVDTAAIEAAEAAKPLKYMFQRLGDMIAAAPLRWIIKGVLPQAQLGVIYGASGSGKSFVAFDIAMCVARGLPWRGKRVTQMQVAYIVAEGSKGFPKRVLAYTQRHGIDPNEVGVRALAAAPNLGEPAEVAHLVRGIKALGDVGLVIVDTLAQVTPGVDENTSKDMNPVIKRCQDISAATGALVLLVHHSGKDAARGARGWSGIRAALDVELEVSRQPTGRCIQLTKSKDDADGAKWGFDLEVVTVGMDEDGDDITSCLVRETEIPVAAPARELGPNEKAVNDVIQELAKTQTEGLEVKWILSEAAERLPRPTTGRDTRKQRVKRALENLCAGDSSPYWVGDDGCLNII